jgi:hypothetical protein
MQRRTAITVNTTDADGDIHSYEKVSGPAWISVWNDGTISGIPENSDAGSCQVVVRVIDAAGQYDDATVQLTVSTGTEPPPPAIDPQTYPITDNKFIYSGLEASTVQTLDSLHDIRSTASANFSIFIRWI